MTRTASSPDRFVWKQAFTRSLDMVGSTSRIFPRLGDRVEEHRAAAMGGFARTRFLLRSELE
ncbi:hypothetical protein X756_26025 [Mesorhizobium sp. LSHC412B00]|nr:hypothetical protein X756_26025 [Mesorhizobium sp. LSHC412B00]